MALELTKTYKGHSYKYWKIILHVRNLKKGTTSAIMTPYKDRATRLADINNNIEAMQRSFIFNSLINTRAGLYTEIKKSKLATMDDVLSGQAANVDDEMNDFKNASDVLE